MYGFRNPKRGNFAIKTSFFRDFKKILAIWGIVWYYIEAVQRQQQEGADYDGKM
jgi:hypothetical protein